MQYIQTKNANDLGVFKARPIISIPSKCSSGHEHARIVDNDKAKPPATTRIIEGFDDQKKPSVRAENKVKKSDMETFK